MKRVKYLAWVPTGPNAWGHHWMKGPVSFAGWRPCYSVSVTAMEMLGFSRTAALTADEEHTRPLDAEYAKYCGIIAAADSVVRSEH